ncbi:MAG: protein jag [Minisyncoccales bacterium]|jgi:spoIIIJ-associated protein
MLNEKDLKRIEERIKEFFKKADQEIELEMSFNEEEKNVLEINICKLDDAKMFIGRQGIVLSHIQLLLRKMLKKDLDKDVYLFLDIDNYRKDKIDGYKSIANSAAEEVSITGQQKILSHLSSYARRIIHLELAKRDDVKTESIGEGEERKLVIKPKL